MGWTVRCALAFFVTLPAIAAGQPVHHRYPLAPPDARPSGIGADERGAWFSESGAGRIATLSGRAELVEYEIPDSGSRPFAVAPARLEGTIVFTDAGRNRIGLLNAGGRFSWMDIPTPDSEPLGVVFDFASTVWFTEHAADRIGFVPAGQTTAQELALPAGSAPFGITIGPDQRVWFTEPGSNRIGSIDRTGARAEFVVPTPDSGPTSIVAGWDGALWFTEWRANRIGRMTVLGEVQEFAIPTPDSEPADLGATADGLWFTERAAGKIGFIRHDGSIREYALPDGARPEGLAFAPGDVWYVDPPSNVVGRVSVNTLYAIGAGAIGTWDTRFTLRARANEPSAARVGLPPSAGVCPGQCFDQAIVLDLSSGEPRSANASDVPYDGGIDRFQIDDVGGDLGDFTDFPDVEAGVTNAALPAQTGVLPLVDYWTIADAEPPASGRGRDALQPMLRFPARREPGVHANLVVSVIEGESSGGLSLRIEAVRDETVVASKSLFGEETTFFLVDVLKSLGLESFDGELRVTRQSARALFWGVLASVRIDGVDFAPPTPELVSSSDEQQPAD